ncbi:hypothetical protein CXG81DRAFT_12227 [Caulochytrium protostelioides]|uniref:Uncharacterized protein n=1 Tax=Caulochytrium protostelioides TaxID=1555241 RepID=A0A4V1IUP3_9FUNG|nr:hypothetical protein CXG81DRAFT_12227 [Caulochytrium protostelioides]|eukprot:RKP01259.1 hypothetical protein CXG81DRAFT_12227 [Caulochytrium protostelioides]
MPRAQPGEAFAHPLYTARPTVDTSLGPVIPPLHYPENDQSVVSTAESGINQEPYYRPTDFDDPKDAPLGGYPQVRHQWALLRNPFTYWDPQGRRNYGEILPDNYNLVDVWGPGPTAPLRDVGRAIFIIAGAVLTVTAGIAVWDPAHHRAIAPKDYPFDGLRISMGGDPQNPQDRELVAPTYSER